jgi:hypothetical protein
MPATPLMGEFIAAGRGSLLHATATALAQITSFTPSLVIGRKAFAVLKARTSVSRIPRSAAPMPKSALKELVGLWGFWLQELRRWSLQIQLDHQIHAQTEQTRSMEDEARACVRVEREAGAAQCD